MLRKGPFVEDTEGFVGKKLLRLFFLLTNVFVRNLPNGVIGKISQSCHVTTPNTQ